MVRCIWPNQAHGVQHLHVWLPAPRPGPGPPHAFLPPPPASGETPWTSFLGSQAREVQARAMAARNFGSVRAGGRWGGARGNPRVTALPFPSSLLIICSPLPSLSSILSLVLAFFLSAFSVASYCLVAEILIVVAGKENLPPSRFGSMVFGC